MKQFKDPTKNAVRHIFEPYLNEHGFTRHKEKDFNRIRGDLVDHIYFGFGRWGSEVMYIYFSTHLLLDPTLNINTYTIGDRISEKWNPVDHDSAINCANHIVKQLDQSALKWFNYMDSVEKYQGAICNHSSQLAFSAISINDYSRAEIYLKNSIAIKKPLIFESDYPGYRDHETLKDEGLLSLEKDALDALLNGKIEQWKMDTRKTQSLKLGIKY